ncbi:hypothetical protein [Nocardia sp. NPDC052566]|uniref:hypothetical protein n=1 Tax=Nocardia sp. NPDC052566 TaxID=3364330 RepID=UPI0037CAA678
MPLHETRIRFTEAEATEIDHAVDRARTQRVVDELLSRLRVNNGSIRDLKKGPATQKQLEQARAAAEDNLNLLRSLPESEFRDDTLTAIDAVLRRIDEGLKMLTDGHA